MTPYMNMELWWLCRYCGHANNTRSLQNWSIAEPSLEKHYYGVGHERCRQQAILRASDTPVAWRPPPQGVISCKNGSKAEHTVEECVPCTRYPRCYELHPPPLHHRYLVPAPTPCSLP
jgi:hypothetical protein